MSRSARDSSVSSADVLIALGKVTVPRNVELMLVVRSVREGITLHCVRSKLEREGE